jgi:2-polyprenyl-3-methyl-5-hydroxy-6-metoxy-1,4-benzoquinol methylase
MSQPLPYPSAAAIAEVKPQGYFSCSRPELEPLIPARATRILEIGCGEGGFARTLRAARPGSKLEIVGVEAHESAGRIAASVLDRLIVGNAEEVELEYEDYFDCVVFADVLEHLVDPWRMVRRAGMFLRNEGTIVASIPNVQHWEVLANLLRGRWEYAQYGIMDRTHLRFFTRRSIRDLFVSSGFIPRTIAPLVGTTARAQIVRFATAGLAVPFLARQYLILADQVVAGRER